MLEGDSADMCGGKILILTMGDLAENLACADPGARTSIGPRGIHVACVAHITLRLCLMLRY
jgi:hypothetical protein